MSRTIAREAAMKLLYEYSITNELSKESMELMPDKMESEALNEENFGYIDFVMDNFLLHQPEIDAVIQAHSKSWKFDRIAKVDLAILRLAIFEIDYVEAVPSKVAVNEAVELAKKFSAEKSYQFVNGLLGGYLRSKKQA